MADFAFNVVPLGPNPTWITHALTAGADIFNNGSYSWRWLGEDITGGKFKTLRSYVFSKVVAGRIWCVHVVKVQMDGEEQYIAHSGFEGSLDREAVDEFVRDFEIKTPIQDMVPVIQL